MILRRAHTTDTGALHLRTAGIIPMATAATAGLVFMEMGKTVSQKVRFNTVLPLLCLQKQSNKLFFVFQESPRE